jgi:hypothetical protein
MSDVLNLLCDYAAAGAVVDRSLIAKVESEIARLTERLEAAEELRCELRLCAHCMEVTECYVHAMADVIVWVCSKCQNDADTEFRDYEEDVR